MHNLLVATDLTDRSRHAVYRSVQLTRQFHALLTVLYVIEKELPDEITRCLRAGAEKLISDQLAKAREKGDAAPVVRIEQGKDYAEINRCAEGTHAELVVLGMHHEARFRDIVIGTAADRLIRLSPRPILIVKHRPRHPYQNILVALDFSSCAWAALRCALTLFPTAVFHVVNAFMEAYAGLTVDEDYHRAQQRAHKREIRDLLNDEIRQVMPQLVGQPPGVHPLFEEGEPVEVILGACARLKPDLLVVDAHGTTGRFLLGGVSTALLHEPPTDLLVVRA